MSKKPRLTLRLLPELFAICRLAPESPIPDWVDDRQWISMTRTDEELSIVCRESLVPSEVQMEGGWRIFKLLGPFPFDLVGILSSVLTPLAERGVSIFAVSTFDTDYVMVKGDALDAACGALKDADHRIETTSL